MNPRPVLVIDYGAQYNQLIARRIRELNVFCEVVPSRLSAPEILAKHPRALILSGGPASVYDDGAPPVEPALLTAGVPVLGICYGMQGFTHALGGRVKPTGRREYGRARLTVLAPSPLLDKIPTGTTVWMSHGDEVVEPPPGFSVLAATDECPLAVIGDTSRAIYGVQFHPEVGHTEAGMEILRNFLSGVAKIEPNWRAQDFIAEAIAGIQIQVGERHALIALSGGVDSAVAAALAEKALENRLHAIMVDHGLLRSGEVEEVREAFPHLDLEVVDARERFMAALQNVSDPEAKRKIIGREFIRVFEAEAEKRRGIDFLIQGTVYPDVIESGGTQASTIKSHHNVGGLPADLRFRLVEPLRWLFKDEVRRVGAALGLPEELVWRQPFPGPGLAVRVLGAVTEDKIACVRAADAIVREEVRRAGVERSIWQAFVVLLDVRSVGVMGDRRTYGYPVAIRAVSSDDGMTADWVHLPYALLDKMARRIVGEVPGVNRVVYDITSKPPGTIEWE